MGVNAFVHRGTVTLPTEIRNPPSLTLRTARYDKTVDAYVLVDDGGILNLPLAEEEHVAALGNVGCRTTGLMSTFLVIATRERLTIGRLDIANSTYGVTGTIEGDGDESCLECWLADGPTVVARYRSKVVVASERQEQNVPYVAFEGLGFPKWKADMLEGSFQCVFVAGNQVLCVSTGDSSSSESADLLSFSLPFDNQVGRYTPSLARVELPLEFDPCLISCVAYVRSALGLLYTVVFGTSDGRLKCCIHNKVIMEVTLEESPLSVTIAESTHGVPVLVVRLGGMDRKIVTFFADSLHQINSWTGIHQVVVDDLARVGHDQMLLITQPSTSSAVSFDHCLRISLLDPGSQNANENHRSKTLKSIDEALEIRLQEGVKELQAAEQRRLDKMQMLTSACNLMQSIATQGMDVPDDAVYMESVQLQEIYMGRCFLIMNVHLKNNLPEDFHLRRPTLFATSLQGFVKSMASCLPSQGNSLRFLFSFPLKECNFPFHIILAAQISVEKSMGDPTGANFGVEGSKSSKIYTQWIHSVEDLTVSNLESGSLRSPTAVCEKWMSLGGAIPQDHLNALVRAVVLQTNPGNYTWSTFKDDRVDEHTRAPLTSMYMQDISLVSKNTNFLDTLSNLYGPRLLEMVIQFADVLLDEIQSCANSHGSDFSLTELQAATDRCFCHLLSSIMYNSFRHF